MDLVSTYHHHQVLGARKAGNAEATREVVVAQVRGWETHCMAGEYATHAVFDRGCISASDSAGESLTLGVGSLGLVLRRPCWNWSRWHFGVAVVEGGKCRTIAEVRPGSARPRLSIALIRVDAAGAPMQAW